VLKKLSEHVYYSPPEPETDRPILGAVVGTTRTLMIDAGNSPRHARTFLDLLDRQTARTPDLVVLTHWHWDHTFGLSEVNAPAVAHRNIRTRLAALEGLSWEDEALDTRVAQGEEIAFCSEAIKKEYGDQRTITIVQPQTTYQTELTLDLGGVECRLLWMPNSHTDDATVVMIEPDGVLFLGDVTGPDLYSHPVVYRAPEVLEMMARVRDLDARWLIESHYKPLSHKEFWQEVGVLEKLAEAIEDGERDPGALGSVVRNAQHRALEPDDLEMIGQFLRGAEAQ